MNRPTLADLVQSRFPGELGLCSDNIPGIAAAANSAVQRLLYAPESGDSGWIGGWAEIAFTPSQTDPFITTPREVARIIAMDVCSWPVSVNNQWYEYLRWGFGKQPKNACASRQCPQLAAYARGVVPSFSDIVPPGKKVRVRITDPADVGKRVLIGGRDSNDQIIYSLDGTIQVQGVFLDLAAPFVDTPMEISKLLSVQKDVTLGSVAFYEYDTVTTDERLILQMQPSETNAAYRRYQLTGLPKSCCNPPSPTTNTVAVSAMCKLDYIPLVTLTDYLLVPNVEALGEEMKVARYLGMDEPEAKSQALLHHKLAIRSLNGQSVHEEGREQVAINFAPFGSARLSRQNIGTNW